MQFHLPTDTEEKPKLTFLIKHALKELRHEFSQIRKLQYAC